MVETSDDAGVRGTAAVWLASAGIHVEVTARQLPTDSIVARFERQARTHEHNGDGVPLIGQTFSRGPTRARQDSLLDALERLVDGSTDRHVRSFAALMIASAGEADRDAPLTGIVERIGRILRRHMEIEDLSMQDFILSSLPFQGERAEALALLRSIASEPDDPGADCCSAILEVPDTPSRDPRVVALWSLAAMGEDGRAVLQAMHGSGEVKSPMARTILNLIAQRGFPVTNALEARRESNRRTLSQ